MFTFLLTIGFIAPVLAVVYYLFSGKRHMNSPLEKMIEVAGNQAITPPWFDYAKKHKLTLNKPVIGPLNQDQMEALKPGITPVMRSGQYSLA